ncbi:hypothetical protein [Domibacillus tundrae]|nr:hypothetical protein [Domibacillus tundrae]
MMNHYSVAYDKLFNILSKMEPNDDEDEDGLDEFAAERNEQQ